MTYANIEDRNTVIFMYTKWCKYSKYFFPIWIKTISKFVNSDYKFKTYDLDQPEKYVIAQDIFNVKQTPSIFLLRGETLDDGKKYTGELDEGQFTEFLTDNLNA